MFENWTFYPLFLFPLGELYFCAGSDLSLLQRDLAVQIVNTDLEFEYEGYNTDFGPLTLNFVHKFITKIDAAMLLNSSPNNLGLNDEKRVVVHHCSQNYKH